MWAALREPFEPARRVQQQMAQARWSEAARALQARQRRLLEGAEPDVAALREVNTDLLVVTLREGNPFAVERLCRVMASLAAVLWPRSVVEAGEALALAQTLGISSPSALLLARALGRFSPDAAMHYVRAVLFQAAGNASWQQGARADALKHWSAATAACEEVVTGGGPLQGRALLRASWLRLCRAEETCGGEAVAVGRQALAVLKPFTLSPWGQWLYAFHFIDAPRHLQRVRALDVLATLAEAREREADVLHLLACRGPRAAGMSPMEADRLAAIAARLARGQRAPSPSRLAYEAAVAAFAAGRALPPPPEVVEDAFGAAHGVLHWWQCGGGWGAAAGLVRFYVAQGEGLAAPALRPVWLLLRGLCCGDEAREEADVALVRPLLALACRRASLPAAGVDFVFHSFSAALFPDLAWLALRVVEGEEPRGWSDAALAEVVLLGAATLRRESPLQARRLLLRWRQVSQKV